MDRRRSLYALAAGTAFSVLMAGSGSAQHATQPNGGAGRDRPERPLQNRWRDMSPEDRQRFKSNIERWRGMPPEERRELRLREGWRQQRLKREAEEALRQSGLQLEAERQQQYELRYLQERKRIEQALRRELQEKRQRELAPVVEQLKKEFSSQTSAAPTATAKASVSSSPAK